MTVITKCYFIVYACDFPSAACQNVCCEKRSTTTPTQVQLPALSGVVIMFVALKRPGRA